MTSPREGSAALPIHGVRAALDAALARGPVVVSSPTGSGKSTEVPRWCAARGRVLVVEPRRVACRSLAARVADLEGVALGSTVGYAVRDEVVSGPDTRILFATPGIVLRARGLTDQAAVLVLDEFHERGLDLDLLLGLFAPSAARPPRLVVMSATLDGDRVAAHLGATHVAATGRAFPVDIRHLDPGAALPSPDELVPRVVQALRAAAADPGDVLVFLPGKAEIEACARVLRGGAWTVIPLHGGLSLDQQRRAFAPAPQRKVILATNVAETSLTLPGVGVVIDTGLVRRTRYHAGRGFLALGAVAQDSAAQRAGRAGRTAPGVCYRLWGRGAGLERVTPPEMFRESLVPLVLGAAAWGARVEDLPLLDRPHPHALTAAREALGALGALTPDGALSPQGESLYTMPLDPPLARLLVEARARGTLDDMIDLVAVLAVGRPLRVRGMEPEEEAPGALGGCDASALVVTLRTASARDLGVSAGALEEARTMRARLRRLHGLGGEGPREDRVDREALVATALAADPRMAYVARRHGRSVGFGNGGTEIALGRETLAQAERDPEALVVWESRALGAGREARVLVTCATVVTLADLVAAGIGADRLGDVVWDKGRVMAQVERVYAQRVLATRLEPPTGPIAREAVAALYLRGTIFKGALPVARERMSLAALALRLGFGDEVDPTVRACPTLEPWVAARLEALGLEHGDDLALLSPGDLVPPDVPGWVREKIERDHPRTVNVGDAVYAATYDLDARRVLLTLVRGQRSEPPPRAYLPRFAGLTVMVSGPRGVTTLRG